MSAFLVKLYPNQDVTEGLEQAILTLGLNRAKIVAAVGSLVEGVIVRDEQAKVVDGPAIEIAALSGDIHARGGSRLHGFLCCQNTQVVEGELVRGRNAVAVTFELLLESSDSG